MKSVLKSVSARAVAPVLAVMAVMAITVLSVSCNHEAAEVVKEKTNAVMIVPVLNTEEEYKALSYKYMAQNLSGENSDSSFRDLVLVEGNKYRPLKNLSSGAWKITVTAYSDGVRVMSGSIVAEIGSSTDVIMVNLYPVSVSQTNRTGDLELMLSARWEEGREDGSFRVKVYSSGNSSGAGNSAGSGSSGPVLQRELSLAALRENGSITAGTVVEKLEAGKYCVETRYENGSVVIGPNYTEVTVADGYCTLLSCCVDEVSAVSVSVGAETLYGAVLHNGEGCYSFVPGKNSVEPEQWTWYVNGTVVSTSSELTWQTDKAGLFYITCVAGAFVNGKPDLFASTYRLKMNIQSSLGKSGF